MIGFIVQLTIDQVSAQVSRAPVDASRNTMPGASLDEYKSLREYSGALGRRRTNWEVIPDSCIGRQGWLPGKMKTAAAGN
jgi:hypothetical protein